jgi:regulatory protein
MSDPKSIHELNADLFQPEEVDRYADPKEIRKKAMDYLARREYASGELIAKMERAGYDADLTFVEVGRLSEEGLQSDARFAESFVQSRINQGKGPVRVRQELKERGVNPSTVDNAIEETGTDWTRLAQDVRQRKFGAELPGNFNEKARQMRFLQYRGFESGHIRNAVSTHGED